MTFTMGTGDALTLSIMTISFVVWLIRLEGKTERNDDRAKDNEKAIEKLEVKHDALNNKIVEKLSVIERSLAKIEGQLSIEHERSD